MIAPDREIKRMIFATLLSLSIYGIVAYLIDLGTEKCPWDTKKTRFIVMIIIAIIALYVLFGHYKNVASVKAMKRAQKYGSKSLMTTNSVSAPAS